MLFSDADQCTKEETENPPLVLAAYHVPCNLLKETEPSSENTEDTGNEAFHVRIKTVGEASDDNIEDISIQSEDGENNTFLVVLNKCTDVNKQSSSGTTALHVACKRGSTEMVEKLLHHRQGITAVNWVDNHKNTPLHIACAHGNDEMCKALIDADAGAHTEEKNNDGMNPLHIAALEHNQAVVKMFFINETCVEHKENLLADKDNNGHTPFLLAVKSGDVEVVKCLMNNGADLTVKNKHDENALHLAAMANYTEILKILWL